MCVFGSGVAEAQTRRTKNVAPAPERPAAERPVKRTIIGLYDSQQEASPAATRLHRMLEMPLNHLGYRLTYWDIAKGLPGPSDLAGVHAFATWFSGRVTNADAYLAWAAATAALGIKAIVIDSAGMLGSAEELAAINGFLRHLGLEYADYYVSDTARTRIVTRDAGILDFERKLDIVDLAHHVVRVRQNAGIRRHLELSDPAHVWAKATSSTLVATGPGGGFVASGFAVRDDTDGRRSRWVIDPFAFLARALGQSFPIPDTTTVSGRRIFFSHIDGDGWNNRVDLPGDRDQGGRNAEIILRDLIDPFSDLPVSVGLIASDIDPNHGGEAAAADLARRYFAKPQVEVASHTHTHPFDWQFVDAYDREAELQRLVTFADKQPILADRTLAALVKSFRERRPKPDATTASAQTGPYDLPRVKVHKPFRLDEEVQGALDISTQLAPTGKPAKLYLWSGNTSPGEAVVRATRQAGVRNMNGGDSRLDGEYPSHIYVPAIGKPVGAERQIYAAASNEFTYTNGFTAPLDGFRRLIETVAATENPRRLKPFNIYYHMYSASRPESLAAVASNLAVARAAKVAPIEASVYAAIADSFYGVEIVELRRGTWRIANRGALDTFRFDDATALPDYTASRGVIGHTRHAGSLYVALDPTVPDAMIVLGADRARGPTTAPQPHLVESRWRVSGVQQEPCRISGRAQGYGAGDMTWANLTPGRYRVDVSRTAGPAEPREAAVGPDGRLAVTLPGDGIAGVTFAINCR